MRVIAHKYLPARFPVSLTVAFIALLKAFDCPWWTFGIVIGVSSLWCGLCLFSILNDDHLPPYQVK